MEVISNSSHKPTAAKANSFLCALRGATAEVGSYIPRLTARFGCHHARAPTRALVGLVARKCFSCNVPIGPPAVSVLGWIRYEETAPTKEGLYLICGARRRRIQFARVGSTATSTRRHARMLPVVTIGSWPKRESSDRRQTAGSAALLPVK